MTSAPQRPDGPSRARRPPVPVTIDRWHGSPTPPRKVPTSIRRLLGPLVLLMAWWLAAVSGLLDERTFPGPGEVLAAAGDLLRTGELQEAVAASSVRVLAGLSLGVVAGGVLALLSGLVPLMEDLIDAPVQIVRTLPVVALVPLAIVWFGIGETSKVLLIAWATAFPIYLNTFAAVRAVDRSYAELGRSLKLARSVVLRRVVLPGAMPGFLVGLRYSMTLAWIVLVVTEQVNAPSGLGHLLTQARSLFAVDVMAVCLLTYGVLGWGSDAVVRALEKSALSWRRSGFMR